MKHLGKWNLLGVLVDALDYDAAVDAVIQAARGPHAFNLTALAVHGVMTGALDPKHAMRLNSFDVVTPDGQPVRWALNLLHGTRLKDRVCGPDLMLMVCQRCAQEGIPIYLYGSRPTVIEALEKELIKICPALKVAGKEPSKFRLISAIEKREITKRIQDSGARVVFVGLGCPRQETFAFNNRESLGIPMLAVGAAFDFHAGLISRAPVWMGSVGLEWFFRLCTDPRRLWKRYCQLNPLYLWMVFLQFTGLKNYPIPKKGPAAVEDPIDNVA